MSDLTMWCGYRDSNSGLHRICILIAKDSRKKEPELLLSLVYLTKCAKQVKQTIILPLGLYIGYQRVMSSPLE